MKQLKLFIASLWLALTTAVVSAVVPVGLPHTVTHGSAFNPATSVVALKASSSQLHRAAFRRADDGDRSQRRGAMWEIVLPAEIAAIAAPRAIERSQHGLALANLFLSPVHSTQYARGPPLANFSAAA